MPSADETTPPPSPWTPPSSDAPTPEPNPQGPNPQGPYPPGPYAAGPYPPPPYGWQQQPAPPQGFNGFAITAAVLGVLGFACCLWVPAIGFGVAALNQIRRTNEKGRGLAVTGLVAAVVWLMVLGAYAVTVVGRADPLPIGGGTSPVTGPRSVGVLHLSAGDCFDRVAATPSVVHTVPCADPHDGETLGSTALTGHVFPGVPAIGREADGGCQRVSQEYAMDTWAVPTSVKIHYFYPTEDSWKPVGPNAAVCVFLSSGQQKLTGSLRKDSGTLTFDQVAYLSAVNEEALVDEPGAGASEAAERLWAGKEADVVTREIGSLEAYPWSADAKQPVAAFVAELKKVLPHLRAAQQSTDPGTLADELEQADRDLTPRAKAVRAALGLATSRVATGTPAKV